MYELSNVTGKIGTPRGGAVPASIPQDGELGCEPRPDSGAETPANQPVRTRTDPGSSDEITKTPQGATQINEDGIDKRRVVDDRASRIRGYPSLLPSRPCDGRVQGRRLGYRGCVSSSRVPGGSYNRRSCMEVEEEDER